ncbi:hypothetical protein SAMN05444959_1205 [Paracoccus seriniphilus]|uniref:Uncharacterized protein n=2 Tax=Paracoccus seriniphilus TaxID=184748 RepID=A0A239Q1H4_9RHOB|nr:hypothetical protein JHW44_09820 [Paracoccus seriniphilus]SNT76439.1 hypothetical protein SAMN05444959_1205 [Paracoccus seriniphilus]
MIDVTSLIKRADAYKRAAGISEDKTVSYRVFGDGKKLSAMRAGADITTRRFNAAMEWFDRNWPEDTNCTNHNEYSHVQSEDTDAA